MSERTGLAGSRGSHMKKSQFIALALATAIAAMPVLSTNALAQPIPICPIPTPIGLVCVPGPGGAPGKVFGGSTPWWIFVCPTGIVTAAVVKNARRHKELTAQEAWTCGFLYWWNEGTGKYNGR